MSPSKVKGTFGPKLKTHTKCIPIFLLNTIELGIIAITRLKRRLTIIHKIQDLHFLIDSLVLDYIDQDIRLSPVMKFVLMNAHVQVLS